MAAGIVVALLMIGFSTATFMVGLGFGHSLGTRYRTEEAKKRVDRMAEAVMASIQGHATVVPVQGARTVGDHGEAVN